MKKFLKRLLPDTHPVRLLLHQWRNRLTAELAGNPARKLTVVCVTGTDGKTTTVAMIAHILHTIGISVGAVSTAFFQIRAERESNPTQKTSVDAKTLQRFLRRLVQEGITHVVIEASSHGLMQGRLAGMTPVVAAITNVTMEHLDYHGTMEEYIHAKAELFRMLRGKGTKVLNEDDRTFHPYSTIPSKHTIAYSPKKQLSDVESDGSSVSGKLSTEEGSFNLSLPVPGTFNLENALCAISCAKALGVKSAEAVNALKDFRGAGGRMERIDEGQPFQVYVDFTVTPAAYERTLSSARELSKGRVLVLTGSCGDRMKEKRPLVGKICGTLADIVVVTNEDPYTENPEYIIDDVIEGIPKDLPVFLSTELITMDPPKKYCARIFDRREAIRYLFKAARPGDVVVLSGKGADVTMMTKDGQIPWIETEIAREELRKLIASRS